MPPQSSFLTECALRGALFSLKVQLNDQTVVVKAVGVDADFFEVEDIHAGDTILMCSDGLSNMLEDTEMEGIVSGQGTIEEKARRLVAAANMNGGRDNIAVILVQIEVEK